MSFVGQTPIALSRASLSLKTKLILSLGFLLFTVQALNIFIFNPELDSHNLVLISLTSILVLFSVYLLVSYLVARPIRKLRRFTDQIKKGDWDQKLEINSQDEFESLGLSIKSLLKDMKTDGLTGLYNRKYFDCRLESSYRKASRKESLLGLILIDIDNFKRINDNYGHIQGDRVLKRMGRILNEESRKKDIAFRYGGEELGVLVYDLGAEDLLMLAERIRKRIEQQEFQFQGQLIKVTSSLGCSHLTPRFKSPEAFVQAADFALYQAKSQGKNRSLIAEFKKLGA